MKLTVMGPVKNEAQFIGYSIMAVLPYIHEIIFSCAASTDGTDELLDHIKSKYAGEKLKLLRSPTYDFNVHDRVAYNKAFNDCIEKSTGDAVWFLHPDMIVTNPEKIADIGNKLGLAFYTNITSYARNFQTVISRGRAAKWKNIHGNKFGLHYYGEYGSQNEDFYHSKITGHSYNHFGEAFNSYPYTVQDSGIDVNHYCELKPFKRRYEKMKSCLETLYPNSNPKALEEMAAAHPRVSLEDNMLAFGKFQFKEDENIKPPEVFSKYAEEFGAFTK